MNVAIQIEGIPRIKVKFMLLQENVRKAAATGMGRATLFIQNESKMNLKNLEWVVPGETKSGEERKFPLIRGRWNRGLNYREYFYPGTQVKGHVDTGNLLRSIRTKIGWETAFELIGAIGTDTPYAGYVEAMPGGGYLYKAYREKGAEAKAWIKKYIEEVIKAAARGEVRPAGDMPSPGATEEGGE